MVVALKTVSRKGSCKRECEGVEVPLSQTGLVPGAQCLIPDRHLACPAFAILSTSSPRLLSLRSSQSNDKDKRQSPPLLHGRNGRWQNQLMCLMHRGQQCLSALRDASSSPLLHSSTPPFSPLLLAQSSLANTQLSFRSIIHSLIVDILPCRISSHDLDRDDHARISSSSPPRRGPKYETAFAAFSKIQK